jgi:3-deoxy-D-manno-octulosonic-acid transferase
MLRFLYSFAMLSYALLVRIVSPFHQKARLWTNGRRNLVSAVKQHLSGSEKVIWIHAASLGEFEQGRPLIEAIKAGNPEKKILLTFYSPSGFEVRKNFPLADLVCYLPLDTRRAMSRFVDAVNPEAVFVIKYEFWFNLFAVLRKRNIPLFMVSVIFRADQHFFQWWGRWFLNGLRPVTWFFAQDQQSKSLLEANGFSNVSVSGDTRFDRVLRIAHEASSLSLPESFSDGSKVVVAGSTWPPDEAILVRGIEEFPHVKWIIVPHEVTEDHIDALMKLLPAGSVRWSQIAGSTDGNVIVVDTIGILSSLYRVATLAYIGGGFGKGIHNLLEAAVYHCPVIFGPNHTIFREAHELIATGGGFAISNSAGFLEVFKRLITDEATRERAAAAAGAYVEGGAGATTHILLKTGYSPSL